MIIILLVDHQCLFLILCSQLTLNLNSERHLMSIEHSEVIWNILCKAYFGAPFARSAHVLVLFHLEPAFHCNVQQFTRLLGELHLLC